MYNDLMLSTHGDPPGKQNNQVKIVVPEADKTAQKKIGVPPASLADEDSKKGNNKDNLVHKLKTTKVNVTI